MREMTERFLSDAFGGESMAHMRYQHFADKADAEGLGEVARMFRAISYAEQVHAGNHLRELGGIGSTSDNLQTAFNGETFEIQEMYPVYNETAKFQDENGAVRSTHYALEAEKIHAEMYKRAKEAAQAGKDAELGPVYICPVCGYTAEGKAPERCPICGAPRDTFKAF